MKDNLEILVNLRLFEWTEASSEVGTYVSTVVDQCGDNFEETVEYRGLIMFDLP